MRLFQLAHGVIAAYAALAARPTIDRLRAGYRRWRAPRIDRHDLVRVPISEMAYADLRQRAGEMKTSVGRLSAELLAVVTGQPAMVRQLGPETFCLRAELTRALDLPVAHSCVGPRIVTDIRIPRPVYAELRGWAAGRSFDEGQVAADLLAIAVSQPWAVHHLDRQDLLRLTGDVLSGAADNVLLVTQT